MCGGCGGVSGYGELCVLVCVGASSTVSLHHLPQVSVTLSAVLGASSESGQWLTGHMLEKVMFNLSVWSSEESLALSTVQLLKSVVKSNKRCAKTLLFTVATWRIYRQSMSLFTGHLWPFSVMFSGHSCIAFRRGRGLLLPYLPPSNETSWPVWYAVHLDRGDKSSSLRYSPRIAQ